ncbi:hypothetical protein B566_EDAN000746 [Ephemera danica]|nr:hypothetical protein B566_EDAN000746 [Ephemera danica]
MLVKMFFIMTILIVGCSHVGGKTGACPPMDPNEVGSCGYMCVRDSKCSGDRLCCNTNCERGGRRCELPDYSLVKKPGRCPRGPRNATCAQLCRHDGDCANTTKCCKTSCGTTCQAPDNSTSTHLSS